MIEMRVSTVEAAGKTGQTTKNMVGTAGNTDETVSNAADATD